MDSSAEQDHPDDVGRPGRNASFGEHEELLTGNRHGDVGGTGSPIEGENPPESISLVGFENSQGLPRNGDSPYRRYQLEKSVPSRPTKDLASHQSEAFEKLTDWYKGDAAGPRGSILVLPTGGGKTHTAVYFACRHPISDGYKVLWLAHTHHLLEQAFRTFSGLVTTSVTNQSRSLLTSRIVSGTTGHFRVHQIQTDDDILIASLQATAKAESKHHPALENFIASAKGKLLVVFDEAHHSPAPSYRRLLERLRERCPHMLLLGLTATPTHSDEKKRGWLLKLFPQWIVYQVTPQRLMASKVLAKPHLEQARTSFDPNFTDREYAGWIGTNRDLPEDIVSHLAHSRSRNEFIANYYVNNKARLGKTILFADRWYQCEAICELLRKRGVRADAIFSRVTSTGATPEERNACTKSDNAEVLEAFRNNQLDVLVNIQMATEGTDIPDAQSVFLTRQTTSQILLTQMVGRALRGVEFGGTSDAYIVSFIDDWKQCINWASYGPILGGAEEDEDARERVKRAVDLISIALVRRLAAQIDSGDNTNIEPFKLMLPLGWYLVEFDVSVPLVEKEGEDGDVDHQRQLIMVYQHEKIQFQKLIQALKTRDLQNFEEPDIQLSDVHHDLQNLRDDFFAGGKDYLGASLLGDIFSVARHMAQHEKAEPTFFLFESRDQHDLDVIAQQHIKDDLGHKTVDAALQNEFRRIDRYWKTLYQDYARFKSHYDGCVNRVLHPAKPCDDGGIIGGGTGNDELSDVEKRAIKHRDSWQCICCGETHEPRLEVDHIVSRYYGGTNAFENLQTLCKLCNTLKGDRHIDFRTNTTPLVAIPKETPNFEFPNSPAANDTSNWEKPLRRWINFYYSCSAVRDIACRDNSSREWMITLCQGINSDWLAGRLGFLADQLKKAYRGNGPQKFHVKNDGSNSASEAVTLGKVLEKIERIEGFCVRIRNGMRKVRDDYSQDLSEYPYERALQSDATVASWKRNRLFKVFPAFEAEDYVIDVLNGDGTVAGGNKTLKAVRGTY